MLDDEGTLVQDADVEYVLVVFVADDLLACGDHLSFGAQNPTKNWTILLLFVLNQNLDPFKPNSLVVDLFFQIFRYRVH